MAVVDEEFREVAERVLVHEIGDLGTVVRVEAVVVRVRGREGLEVAGPVGVGEVGDGGFEVLECLMLLALFGMGAWG